MREEREVERVVTGGALADADWDARYEGADARRVDGAAQTDGHDIIYVTPPSPSLSPSDLRLVYIIFEYC